MDYTASLPLGLMGRQVDTKDAPNGDLLTPQKWTPAPTWPGPAITGVRWPDPGHRCHCTGELVDRDYLPVTVSRSRDAWAR